MTTYSCSFRGAEVQQANHMGSLFSGEAHRLWFNIVPESKVGETDQDAHTEELLVHLDVTNTTLLCGVMPRLSKDERLKQFFAFAQERLRDDGVPEVDAKVGYRRRVYVLEGNTHGLRFEKNTPPYTSANIRMTEPFVVKGAGKIGFTANR